MPVGDWSWRPSTGPRILPPLLPDHEGAVKGRSCHNDAHAIARRHSVRSILIVGVDTVVGANMAPVLADHYKVVGLAEIPTPDVSCCDVLSGSTDGASAPRWLAEVQVDTVVYCGAASGSAWDPATIERLDDQMPGTAAAWAAAAQALGHAFVYLTSDAVFSGPWMFHDEESLSVCRSHEAELLREAERRVTAEAPDALIVRTNAYGWAPRATSPGWIEQILLDLDRRSLQKYDFIRHGTPILATDLADILVRALEEDLHGVHHIAGAERVNPLQFAQRLADHFELPWLAVRRVEEALVDPAIGFGAGETSLQTKKIRKALCVAMPMLSEGLRRLREQQQQMGPAHFGPDYPVAIRQSA